MNSNSLKKIILISLSFFCEFGLAAESSFTESSSPAHILQDPENKIAEEFHVPDALNDRTAFWFDIYTKYGVRDHIIHHVLYPWLIYKVVDTTPLYSSSLNRWTKVHREEKLVKQETQNVRKILLRLSNLKVFTNLNPEEKNIFETLSTLPGSRKKVFREALRNLRVQLGQRDFFMAGLINSSKYLPFMETEFAAHKLPTELTRLPFVESSFNVKAESKVGASGIWQIMPATGKMFLIVNEQIDERNSPLKASLAAIEIFKRNFRGLGSWPLAITAYNQGAGGVHHALKMSRTTNLPDLVSRYHRGSFKFASANFYTSFLAALYAEKYKKYLFPSYLTEGRSANEVQVLAVERPLRVTQLLKVTGLEREDLLEYNLDLIKALRANAVIPRGYKIVLPTRTSSALDQKAILKSRSFKEALLKLRAKTST